MQRRLKFAGLTVLGIAVLATLGYQWYLSWVTREYGQHLPRIGITVDTTDREYYVFAPNDVPDAPMPLVFLLNGGDAGHWRFPQQFAWQALAEELGIVLAVPVGKYVQDNEGAWQLNTSASTYQDIDYINHIIDDVAERHVIDPDRLYAVGYSLGSMFAYELACHLSHRFAAIASFAGSMPIRPTDCDPKRHVPLMHIHGVNDPIIAYANTWDWKHWPAVGTMRDIPGLVAFWRSRYRCGTVDTAESPSEVHTVYAECEQNATVEHYQLLAGTHEWPATLGERPTYEVIWAFLSRYALPQTASST